MIEALAPTPKVPKAVVTEIPIVPVAEGEVAAAPVKPAAPEATPEQTAVIVDLHWLIHQGAVLEFADGRMETAKKPLPKPVKQEKKVAAAKPAAETEVAAAIETVTPETLVAEPVAQIESPVENTAAPAVETPVQPEAPATTEGSAA